MFVMRGLLTSAVLFVSMICPLVGRPQMVGYFPKGGDGDIEANDVSLIELIANPSKYDHKTVRIVGYLHLEFEGNAIYLHKEDFQYSLSRNALWIEVPKDMTKEQMKAVNDHYVICTARFVARGHGHMDMNSGEVADVSRLQIWHSTPRETAK
jgi:hypothetical protein